MIEVCFSHMPEIPLLTPRVIREERSAMLNNRYEHDQFSIISPLQENGFWKWPLMSGNVSVPFCYLKISAFFRPELTEKASFVMGIDLFQTELFSQQILTNATIHMVEFLNANGGVLIIDEQIDSIRSVFKESGLMGCQCPAWKLIDLLFHLAPFYYFQQPRSLTLLSLKKIGEYVSRDNLPSILKKIVSPTEEDVKNFIKINTNYVSNKYNDIIPLKSSLEQKLYDITPMYWGHEPHIDNNYQSIIFGSLLTHHLNKLSEHVINRNDDPSDDPFEYIGRVVNRNDAFIDAQFSVQLETNYKFCTQVIHSNIAYKLAMQKLNRNIQL